MRWSLTNLQKDFFQKNLFVEFESFLSEEQTKHLYEHVKKILSHRLAIKQGELSRKSPEEIYLHGRDLFRSDSIIQKEVCRRQFGEIASDLVDQPFLRIAFDQVIASRHSPRYLENGITSPFQQLVDKPSSLKEGSCITEIVCGVIFCLWKANSTKTVDELNPSLLPSKPGNAAYFSPEAPIPMNKLYEDEDALYLMIAYSHPRCSYLLQPIDPLTHYLKTFGYVFGDRLVEKFHPIVFRRN